MPYLVVVLDVVVVVVVGSLAVPKQRIVAQMNAHQRHDIHADVGFGKKFIVVCRLTPNVPFG